MRTHLACWLLAVLAGACALLAAFGIDHLGQVALLPLAIVFLACSLACHQAIHGA